MSFSPSGADAEKELIAVIYEKYVDMVYRIAFVMMKNQQEAEDITQNVFIQLMKQLNKGEFNQEEHLKAWLIVTAQNSCKNLLKSWHRRAVVGFEAEVLENMQDMQDMRDMPYGGSQEGLKTSTHEAVMKLPGKYRLPIYLYYFEGYSTEEISAILRINHATVRTRLRTARRRLKLLLEED